MSTPLRDILQQEAFSVVLNRPWISTGIFIPLLILLIDYLNYYRLRKRLGNIPVVGDASYLWRRLRWTETDASFQKVFQKGYDTVSRSYTRVKSESLLI